MKNELVQMFEDQEVKIVTDEGNTLINLAHTAKCCGLVKSKNGKDYVRWTDKGVIEKLNKIYNYTSESISKEIEEVIVKINNMSKINNIYITIELAMLLANNCFTEKSSKFFNFLNNNFDNQYIKPHVKRSEIEFFNILNPIIKELGYDIKRQLYIDKFRVDGYIEDIKLAIEFDENNHKNYTYEQQDGREEYIKSKLNCNFVRVSDLEDYGVSISKIIKYILNINKNNTEIC
jgi:very-short-patch-repair endonuclease